MPARLPHAWTSIRAGLHLITAVLLAVIVARAVSAEPGIRWQLLAGALVMAGVYALGTTPLVGRDRRRALLWLVTLVAAWLWVLWLVPDGVYLAFPLFFLAAHLLPDRAAVGAVGVLTALAVAGYAVHRGLSFAAVLGPVLGAMVAVATVLGIRAVQQGSARRGVLEERERLAREIHDTLAQGLSSVNLLLGAAAERMPDEPDQALRLVVEARGVVTANLDEARRFVRALAPPELDEAPLADALARAVAEIPGATLSVDGDDRRLASSHDVALLRITREALTNAQRHAGASRIAVTLSQHADSVALDVVDDGAGFDPAAPSTGFGMSSMRARAAELGGTLEVESAPGEGTAVTACLPLADP